MNQELEMGEARGPQVLRRTTASFAGGWHLPSPDPTVRILVVLRVELDPRRGESRLRRDIRPYPGTSRPSRDAPPGIHEKQP
jgi:hypothetical protein